MRKKSGNPDFNYEIACDQLCGKGHYGMKGIVIVESQQEYNAWMSKQVSFYDAAVKGTDAEKKFLAAAEKLKLANEAKEQHQTHE
jgi:cytochrome c oxidase subunit 2